MIFLKEMFKMYETESSYSAKILYKKLQHVWKWPYEKSVAKKKKHIAEYKKVFELKRSLKKSDS